MEIRLNGPIKKFICDLQNFYSPMAKRYNGDSSSVVNISFRNLFKSRLNNPPPLFFNLVVILNFMGNGYIVYNLTLTSSV